MMPSNSDIVVCLEFLLMKLDLSLAIQEDTEESFPKYSSFANSSSGIGALCAGLAHFARQRFELCRDLLLFELILYESDALECEQLDHLLTQSAVIPKTVNLLRSYYIILWCTQCESVPVSLAIQDGWCTENKQLINFLVAGSCLILGESHKAVKLFLEISKEIEGESLLCRKILRGRYVAGTTITSSFCMRVIQMFEQFCISTCIVTLASAAINEIDETDPHLPIFYSVLFKHHLNLGHNEEAFATLMKNPDSSRQKDCLRQLVVKLCEMKQLWKIIDLSYLAFEEEIINILEKRSKKDLFHNTSFILLLCIYTTKNSGKLLPR
ncbi:Nuclear pore complex protein Nup160 [Araneus ventricosus]|uniref:Nuclear pore complex protein Nup160 n=1 Tax=Araneus ventricosus TaxID=182803 RepID=A0A4Y2CDF2_ARAVE|nr:Nuclear pore complex protein Nup160 [Araneus ventricosus]